MIEISNVNVSNIEGACRGLRNPMNSWDKSDSMFGFATSGNDPDVEEMASIYALKKDIQLPKELYQETKLNEMWLKANGRQYVGTGEFIYSYLGPVDLNLAQRMIKAGVSDSKFLRQIFVCMDIDAPFLWWKEMDQYRISTVTNSCSTMHKLSSTPITRECFSFSKDLPFECFDMQDTVIEICEDLRQKYNATQDQRYWRALVEILPEGWNQKRTWSANYEVLRNIINQRKHHRLQEWHDFIAELHQLPYAEELIFFNIDGVKD